MARLFEERQAVRSSAITPGTIRGGVVGFEAMAANARKAVRAALGALLIAGAAVGAITLADDSGPERDATAPAATPSATSAPPPASPSAARSPQPHPVSLPALAADAPAGRDFRTGRVLSRTSEYARFHVTYESDGLTISGVMNVPSGPGPFPVLILNHGYIDPGVYVNGQGMRREQDYLARRGYVVVHIDYRNHAESDRDPNADLELRLGYVRDSINALDAMRSSDLPFADTGRAAMIGRSMGGSVTMRAAVTHPDLFDAYVLFAPTSSDAVDNFDKWTRGRSDRRSLAARIIAAYGSPESNPRFWDDVSPVTFVDRVAAPILIHHGTRDDTCSIEWSERTAAALEAAGKDVQLLRYDDGHAFGPAFPESMRRTVDFLDRHVKTG